MQSRSKWRLAGRPIDHPEQRGILLTSDLHIRNNEEMPGLVAELSVPGIRLILVIGDADTGKSTLVEKLARRLSRDATVGLVDADIGQSHLGPPATVGWGKLSRSFDRWDAVPVEGFYFTGAISPPGNLLQLLTGTGLMVDQALDACDKVIVDTTGLVQGAVGRVLKQQKIDLLMPDVVIAIERENELALVLGPLRHQKRPQVCALPAPEGIRVKSPMEKTAYRADRFRSYFQDADILTIELSEIGLRSTRGDLESATADLSGRLISLRDEGNSDLALGIIEDWAPAASVLKVKTPLQESGKVASAVIGTLGDVI